VGTVWVVSTVAGESPPSNGPDRSSERLALSSYRGYRSNAGQVLPQDRLRTRKSPRGDAFVGVDRPSRRALISENVAESGGS
jgi:hypothetical protein